MAGSAPTDLVYDGFEKAAMIEASGVLLGQISEAGAAIRSIYGYQNGIGNGQAAHPVPGCEQAHTSSRKKRGRF